jgi:hypothetical protein
MLIVDERRAVQRLAGLKHLRRSQPRSVAGSRLIIVCSMNRPAPARWPPSAMNQFWDST